MSCFYSRQNEDKLAFHLEYISSRLNVILDIFIGNSSSSKGIPKKEYNNRYVPMINYRFRVKLITLCCH